MREISVDHCLSLLKQQPIFSAWPTDLLMEFVKQLQVTFFHADEVIVTEGEIINAIYLIVNGKVEVSKHEARDPTKQYVIATLQSGESIGLSQTGLYSATGVRTATVIALTSVSLVTIEIEFLNKFLQQNTQLNSSLESATQQILKLHLIKQAAPFFGLSLDEIKSLEQKVDVIDIAKNTIVFKEGDKGDYCYLIQEGQVEISRKSMNETSQVVAVLSTAAVFGEAAVLMDLPRNATARTVTDVRLLRLLREDLIALISCENQLKQAFGSMILERSRPQYRPGVTAHQQVDDEGVMTVILKNQNNHEYYQLTQEGWLIWQFINGNRTVKEITMALVMEYNIFSPAMVTNLMLDLTRTGFIELLGFRMVQHEKMPRWMKLIDRIKSMLEYEISFPNIDSWLTKVYQNKINGFYTCPMQLGMLVITLVGIIFFALFPLKTMYLIPTTSQLILLIILVDIAGIFSIALHELAHAFTAKHFKREVSHFGIGWFWIGPMAFTDTSDMWLSTKWPRVIVNVAGIWVDLALSGIMAFIAYFMPWPMAALFFWIFSLFIYLNVYHNLYPLIKLDGYYILMDIFDHSNLREDAVKWLVEVFPTLFKKPVFIKIYRDEIIYWLICIIFIILSPFIAWFVQHLVLTTLYPGYHFGYCRLLFPAIVIIISLLSAWVSIQKERRHLR